MMTRSQAEIRQQAESLLPAVQRAAASRFRVSVADCHSQIGSGSLPIETLASAALKLEPASGRDSDLRELAQQLRQLPVPVIGRLHKNALWLDLRCLEPEQQEAFTAQLDSLQL